jgi:uncharacterized membrane protein
MMMMMMMMMMIIIIIIIMMMMQILSAREAVKRTPQCITTARSSVLEKLTGSELV